jgi:hypothetical protein
VGAITISACLWEPNNHNHDFSNCYDEKWALKIFNGFRRHLTRETRCVLFTDQNRNLPTFIEQIVEPDLGQNGYGDCIRPFKLNEPMIFAGLDTVVVGNCDKFANYCFEANKMALPTHPNKPHLAINGVVFCPGGQRHIFDDWRGENDMDWVRKFPHERMENLWPDRILSYKAHVASKSNTLPKGARIVYFHGWAKPHRLGHLGWINQHWQ